MPSPTSTTPDAATGGPPERGALGLARHLRARAVRELGKFGVIGAIAFVVDVGLFNLLRVGVGGAEGVLDEKPLTAKVVSMGTATLVAWAGNRWWTFRARRGPRGRALLPELVLFFAMNGVALLISLVCLGVSHYVLGLRSPVADNISANVVGVALGTVFRFYAYRTWVFRTRPRQPTLPLATGSAVPCVGDDVDGAARVGGADRVGRGGRGGRPDLTA